MALVSNLSLTRTLTKKVGCFHDSQVVNEMYWAHSIILSPSYLMEHLINRYHDIIVISNSKFNTNLPKILFLITIGDIFFSEISFYGLTYPFLGGEERGGRPGTLKKFTNPMQFLTSRAPLCLPGKYINCFPGKQRENRLYFCLHTKMEKCLILYFSGKQ